MAKMKSFGLLYIPLFLLIESSNAFECLRPRIFQNTRLELLDDRTCCSSHAICKYSGFYRASRSRNTFSRDVNFQYFRHFSVTACRMEEVQSNFKSTSFPDIVDGVKGNIRRSSTQLLIRTAFEICVIVARLSLEIFDVVLRVGGLLSALVQLVLNVGKGFMFHRRFLEKRTSNLQLSPAEQDMCAVNGFS